MPFSLRALVASVVPAGALAAALVSYGTHTPGGDAVVLVPGKPVAVRFSDIDEAPVFRVNVPYAATAVHVWTEGANIDLSLGGWSGDNAEEFEDFEEWGTQRVDDWVDEELWLGVNDTLALTPGPWYFRAPISENWLADPTGRDVEYVIHCEVIVPKRQALPFGVPTTVTVTRELGMLAAFECEIGEELLKRDAKLRFELVSPQADVDLLVGPRPAARTVSGAYGQTRSGLAYERLVLPARMTGEHFALQAFAYRDLDPYDSVELTVLMTLDEPDSPTLCPAPRLPTDFGTTPLERALAATVSLVAPIGGGSGVVVSPRGHMLTNAHVVSGAERGFGPGAPVVSVAVAFDLTHLDPTVPTLGARLLEYDQALDLALLVIDSDLTGRPLPAGTTFPYFERRPLDERPAIGDRVWCMGYPMTGGTQSYLTVSATTGMFSGFSPEPGGLQYKVDAAIHSGMSGGACVDEQGRLLGLPSASVTDANEGGSLGFVIPVGSVPAAWWKHLDE